VGNGKAHPARAWPLVALDGNRHNPSTTLARVPNPSDHFSATAQGYAATMAPSLRPVAAEVVRRARLRAGERVLDVGTGTGTAAAMARGDGRTVIGLDGARGMLAIARNQVPGVEFVEADFVALPFADGTFDVVIAVHALLFADDRLAALEEWRRAVRPGGRLSLSVPGPSDVTPTAIYRDIYDRHGIDTSDRYPTTASLADWAAVAGWADVAVAADPTVEIELRDEAAFRTWREIGSRGAATAHFTADQHAALTDEMLAATPRDATGAFRIPFGALYLTAVVP
jgi:SAM-dependent methyltransferase